MIEKKKVCICDYLNIQKAIAEHCVLGHYMFSFKKCNRSDCSISTVCGAKHLDNEVFLGLHHLPFPMRKPTDEKFKHFNDVCGEVTSETHLPSLTEKSHQMPFSPSSQSAKNTGVVVQCGECGKWRCMYSQHKLKKDVAVLLNRFNEEFIYTCGVVLQDVLLDSTYERIQELIFVKVNLNCRIEIEVT